MFIWLLRLWCRTCFVSNSICYFFRCICEIKEAIDSDGILLLKQHSAFSPQKHVANLDIAMWNCVLWCIGPPQSLYAKWSSVLFHYKLGFCGGPDISTTTWYICVRSHRPFSWCQRTQISTASWTYLLFLSLRQSEHTTMLKYHTKVADTLIHTYISPGSLSTDKKWKD